MYLLTILLVNYNFYLNLDEAGVVFLYISEVNINENNLFTNNYKSNYKNSNILVAIIGE